MKKLISLCCILLFAFAQSTCKKNDSDPNDKLTLGQLSSKMSTTPTTPATTTTVNVSFWTKSNILSASSGGIDVYFDGSYQGSISSSFSGTPACKVSGTISFTATVGSHFWQAFPINNSFSWPQTNINFTSTSPTCNTIELK